MSKFFLTRRQISVSEVIRLAIAAWAEQQEPIAAPYEAIADLIGVVRGGMPGRSTQMGTRFSEIVKSRRSRKQFLSTLDRSLLLSTRMISTTKSASLA